MESDWGVSLGWLHALCLASVLLAQAPSAAPVNVDAKASPSASSDDDKKSDDKTKKTGEKTATTSKQESRKDEAKKLTVGKKGQPPSKPATRKATPGPRVLTRSEMEKPRSPFLGTPGSEGDVPDRYGNGGTPDWREIPPWRQTTFFGIRAAGRFFVYVIDCSESMIDEDRFARATMEVRRSVLSLQAPQQFEVIFYNEESIPMPGGPKPRPADPQNKSQLVSWLRLVDPDGGTDPAPRSGRPSPCGPRLSSSSPTASSPTARPRPSPSSTPGGSRSIASTSRAARGATISARSPATAGVSMPRAGGTSRASSERRHGFRIAGFARGAGRAACSSGSKTIGRGPINTSRSQGTNRIGSRPSILGKGSLTRPSF